MKTFRCLLLAAMLAALPTALLAHPLSVSGDAFVAGIAHPFLGFDHLLATVAVGMWAACRACASRWTLLPAFLFAMLAGGALGIMGWVSPMIEPLVAASVLVLGLVVATQARLGAGVAVALAAFFALFHGLAHGSELPVGMAVLGYVAGLTLATATLLASGYAAGRWIYADGGMRAAFPPYSRQKP